LPYYYRKNLFGDIVEIYDDENQLAASYTYDAWGNFTVGTNVDGIAFVNKFRYRGYYYDSDTGYYYLQTRYYDAEVGRFLNADDVKYLNHKIIHGCNLYTYCLNNPVMMFDSYGTFPWIIVAIVAAFVAIAGFITDIIGIGENANDVINAVDATIHSDDARIDYIYDVVLYGTMCDIGITPPNFTSKYFDKYAEEFAPSFDYNYLLNQDYHLLKYSGGISDFSNLSEDDIKKITKFFYSDNVYYARNYIAWYSASTTADAWITVYKDIWDWYTDIDIDDFIGG